MSGALAALPLHLACQMINLSGGNSTIVHNPSVPRLAIDLPEGYTVFPSIGVAYKYYKNPVTWDAARKFCQAEGASLAIVDSYKKVEYIMGMKDPNQGTWTGVHKLFDNTDWTNVKTGESLNFLPWRPDAEKYTGSCIANRHDILGVSAWECHALVPVVCEIPL